MLYNNVEIKCLGHASFKIKNKKQVIYIDPYNLSKKNYEKAEIILITHEHYDHCSPEDIEKVSEETTLIITTQKAAEKIRGNVRIVKEYEKITLGNIIIETVEAYNRDKPFHPRGSGLGFVITINNIKIYHAGDTDLIPEMKNLENIDIALLPVSGVYVMNSDEAAEACEIIAPKIAVPMHYGSIVGDLDNAELFAEQIDESITKVEILSKKECKPGECEATDEN